MKFDYIYGINSVFAVLKAGRRRVNKLMLTQPIGNKYQSLKLAQESSIPIEYHDRDKLEKFASYKPHQGIVAKVSEYEPIPLDEVSILDEYHNTGIFLCLDHITDPQNYGAILRTACFFDCDGVIVTKKNAAPVTPAVCKASSGASEYSYIFEAKDLGDMLRNAKERGYRVIGAGKGTEIRELDKKVRAGDKIILVMGSEGKGLTQKVAKECEDLVWIEGGKESIDSLNVAAASAILIHRLKQILTQS